MAGRRSPLFDVLIETSRAPWWAGLAAAVLVWITLRFAIPAALGDDTPGRMLAPVSTTVAPWLALLFALAAARSALVAHRAKRLHSTTRSLDALRALDWREFEALVAEGYRRAGYRVRTLGGPGADGGVDAELRLDGRTTVVQAKRWRTTNIGVGVVRELFGVMHARGADHAVVVGSGGFTRAARQFARDNGVELVDGSGLLELIAGVDPVRGTRAAASVPADGAVSAAALPVDARVPTRAPAANHVLECEACRAPMKLRRRRGAPPSAQPFWGCSRFPACRHTGPA